MFVKTLGLITPEVAAEQLGLPAEAPVFISAWVYGSQCRLCEPPRSYGPLVYQVGHEVIPHHLHPKQGIGGIYAWQEQFATLVICLSLNHWFAYLEGELAYEVKSEGCALRSAQVVQIQPSWEGAGADGSLEEIHALYLAPAGAYGAYDDAVTSSDWKYRIRGPEIVFSRGDQWGGDPRF